MSAAAGAALALFACGSADRLVIDDGAPPASAYDGPLHVQTKTLDEDTTEAYLAASGAAGMALECDGEIYEGGRVGPWSEGDGGTTPEEGLTRFFDIIHPLVPATGYRIERESADRVLYSYDFDGETRVAVIVAVDRPRAPGWGPETYAWCDPAEMPDTFTAQHFEVWRDVAGQRIPVSVISSDPGSSHCGWQAAHFIEMGRFEDQTHHGRDPEGVLPPGMLVEQFRTTATLPDDAVDSGYRYDEWELWTSQSAIGVFVRTPDGVEYWPAVTSGMGCE